MKIDMHAHSKYSERPSTWILKKIGCAESYTTPKTLYDTAKQRGMTAVTITDHNSIKGILEIMDLPDTFMGCELTAYFPEDRCKVHVLAYGMTERQWEVMDELRENVFELVDYLIQEQLPHALAHPFYSVNERMTVRYFEQCLLLFRNFECNGEEHRYVNDSLRTILDALTPEDIERLANDHSIEPRMDEPWRKCVIAGSDDHSVLNLGKTFTEVVGAQNLDHFWGGVEAGNAMPQIKQSGTPIGMGRNLYSVAYQMYRDKFNLNRFDDRSPLIQFLNGVLDKRKHRSRNRMSEIYSRWRNARNTPGANASVTEALQYEAERLVLSDPQLSAVLSQDMEEVGDKDRHWFRFVNEVTNKMICQITGHTVTRLTTGNPFDFFYSLGSFGALYTLLGPYLAAYSVFASNRHLAKSALDHLAPGSSRPQKARVAHFTDTFADLNGVSRTLAKQVELARRLGKDLTMITCVDDVNHEPYTTGIHYCKPIHMFRMPEYEEQKLFIPPLLELLEYCYARGFTHFHAATPGPIGLAGLLIAKILKRPFYTTYHTSIPQYARSFTDDAMMESLAWRAMIWFCNQATVVFSLSDANSRELISKGISSESLRQMPRGVDTDIFRPDQTTDSFDLPTIPKLLYAGRVSKEKGLDTLAAAYKQICESEGGDFCHLVIVGDGPYMGELRKRLHGLPCTFTGVLTTEELAPLYASCELFVFPSATDTFGNVVLEAQASGLPVIVTDEGGPHENMTNGETGLVTKAGDADDLSQAISALVSDDVRRRTMGLAAREYALKRSYEKAFLEYWQIYEAPEEAPVSSTKALAH